MYYISLRGIALPQRRCPQRIFLLINYTISSDPCQCFLVILLTIFVFLYYVDYRFMRVQLSAFLIIIFTGSCRMAPHVVGAGIAGELTRQRESSRVMPRLLFPQKLRFCGSPVSSAEMGERADQVDTAFYAVSPWNPFPKTERTAAERESAKFVHQVF